MRVAARSHADLVSAADGMNAVRRHLLLLNFVDGLYKLAKVNWHIAYQIMMTIIYIALSVRLIQLILAFAAASDRRSPAQSGIAAGA
ncbi:hypothetical protein [Bradyrhizobium hereditatis]|uniref:hypothetical protein n=1 Tax=Bradyrhizobium hereditatis TaxID=2821405 RepID=UPI001CE2A865|nr:hypothetical protein [Bradyrhizobium hereditatis]